MKRVLVGVGIVAAVAGFAVGASAQSGGPLTLLSMVQRLAARVDVLQARSDSYLPPATSLAWLDVATASPGVISVGGWAFACAESPIFAFGGELFVAVDGIEVPVLDVSRVNRPDVAAAFPSLCEPGMFVPLRSGFNSSIPIAPFGSGPAGDGRHILQVRVYDKAGRVAQSWITAVQVPTP